MRTIINTILALCYVIYLGFIGLPKDVKAVSLGLIGIAPMFLGALWIASLGLPKLYTFLLILVLCGCVGGLFKKLIDKEE